MSISLIHGVLTIPAWITFLVIALVLSLVARWSGETGIDPDFGIPWGGPACSLVNWALYASLISFLIEFGIPGIVAVLLFFVFYTLNTFSNITSHPTFYAALKHAHKANPGWFARYLTALGASIDAAEAAKKAAKAAENAARTANDTQTQVVDAEV